MKTLQLKNYLLVEPENPVYLTVSESGLFYADPESHESELIEGKFKFICMGDDFEQDQKATKKDACVLGQIFCKLGFNAFVKEVKEAGFYWGENPIEKPSLNDLNGSFFTMQWNFNKEKEYEESESRNFNPSKTKIYQVIS